MAFISVMVLIYLVALILGRTTNLPFGYLFAPAIFSIVIWQYIFGLLGLLNFGMEALAITASTIFIYLFLRYREFRQQILRSVTSVSSITMLLLSFVSHFKTKDWLLSTWDEFSTWGLAVKAMYKYGALAPSTPADLWTPEYPPGIALFQYFVMDTDFGWNEGYLFWSIHLVALSILVAVLAQCSFKNISEIAVRFFASLIAAATFFNYWNNIYADGTLAITFAFMFFIAIRGDSLKGRSTIILVTTAGFLTLLKPTAIYFALAAILVNIVMTTTSIRNFSVRNLISQLRPAGTVLTAVVAIWVSWQEYISRLGVQAVMGTGIPTNFDRLANEKFNSDLISNYVAAYFNRGINPPPIASMPASDWTIICLVFFAVWMYFSGRINLWRNSAIGISILVTTVGYFGLILYSYVFLFVPVEAAGLAGYERYISTWYQGIFLAIVMLILSEIKLNQEVNFPFSKDSITKKSISNKQLGVLVTAFISLNLISSANSYLNMLRAPQYVGSEWRAPFAPMLKAIKRAGIPEGSRVYIITQHKVGYEYYVLRYEMIGLDFGAVHFSLGTPSGAGDIWTDPTTDANKWSKTLRDFDYVVLYNTTESFNSEFSSVFKDGMVEPGHVYKVNKSTNEVLLVKVG